MDLNPSISVMEITYCFDRLLTDVIQDVLQAPSVPGLDGSSPLLIKTAGHFT
jgi:hypothetical protein